MGVWETESDLEIWHTRYDVLDSAAKEGKCRFLLPHPDHGT